jgi:uncharacterized protein (TIGR02996 family)
MSEADGFLQAIIAEPDDDTHRLVYADWLDEHGQPERADLIRIQCALARLRYDDDAVSELQAREYRLLARHLPRWREQMGYPHARVRRGFVEEAPIDHPPSFVEDGGKQFASHPIREVDFGCQEATGWGKDVAACPWLSRIETLRLPQHRSCWTDLSDFIAILSSPHLTNVTTLDAGGGHRYGDAGLREILGTSRRKAGRKDGLLPALRNLRRLSLNDMDLTDRGLRALAHSPLAETLTHLDLSNGLASSTRITADGIAALVESPLWPRLEELNLSYHAFPDATAIRMLFGALHRSRLTKLSLRGSCSYDVRWEGLAEAMLTAPSWGRLEALDLGSAGLSNEGLRLILREQALGGLRWLAFDHGLNDEGVKDLAACPHAARLTALWIGGTSTCMTDQGMKALAGSPFLTQLAYLNVNDCSVHDEGVASFVSSPNAARLRILELPSSIGDKGLQALAASPFVERLNVITLSGSVVDGYRTKLSDSGLLAVTGSSRLPNLACLDLKRILAGAAGSRSGSEFSKRGITRAGCQALLECERLACAPGPNSHGETDLDRAFRARFPLSRWELTGFRPLRLFPWSRYTYP